MNYAMIVRLEAFIAVLLKVRVCWDVMLCHWINSSVNWLSGAWGSLVVKVMHYYLACQSS